LVLAACSGSNGASPQATNTEIAEAKASALAAPMAEKRPYDVVSPHGTRNDPYYWLRDDTRKDPAMLAYLTAENEYANRALAPVKELENKLFEEMRSRIKEDDSSVPIFNEGYWYYSRFETGKQQPIYVRRKTTMEAPEEILLDGNALAEGHSFYRIGRYVVTRDGNLLAWAEDTVGRNQYTLRFKDLKTNTVLADTAKNISPSMAWANDNKTLFYTGKDETTLRPDRVFRHVLGATAPDEQVFKEDDAQFYVGVGKTKSHKYIVIGVSATMLSESRLIDADKPMGPPRVVLARTKDHIYDIDHLDGRFLFRSNNAGKNFRVAEAKEGSEGNPKKWKDVIAHRDDTLVEEFAVYHGFLAASVRSGGLRKVLVLPAKKPQYFLDAPDPTYAMSVVDTPDAKTTSVRFNYDSMVAPLSVFEVDVLSKARKLLKQQPVPGYDPSLYASEYVHAVAADGVRIPISISYKKTTPLDGTSPLFMYGYGSYGYSMEPRFDQTTVSMLERGFIYAIAHVRGGEEMGRAWYEEGKLLKKMNTFTDFIAATEHLVTRHYGSKDQVYAMGGSAGGLLMGAIVNLRPELYRGIVALVPFVDVVTTMLDESIPLTTNEMDEWGNPKEKASYDYMLAYSPYDNVRAQAYPSIYVRTGLWDSQVQYFEPAKWVAKLRATKTNDNLLVMDTDMTSGHGGASGRFDRLRQTARAMSFVLHVKDRPDAR
jgi:oligopeptidase B